MVKESKGWNGGEYHDLTTPMENAGRANDAFIGGGSVNRLITRKAAKRSSPPPHFKNTWAKRTLYSWICRQPTHTPRPISQAP